MPTWTRGAVICTATMLAGCSGGASVVVDQPSSITLREALVSAVDAIAASRQRASELRALNNGVPIGMNVCSVKATFNVTAEGTTKSGVDGTLGTPKDLYVSATITASRSDSLTTHRGNQIEVTFTSPACNPADTLGTKSPGDVVLLEREIEAAREGAPDPIHRGSPSRRRGAPGEGQRSTAGAGTPTVAGNGPEDKSGLGDPAPGAGSTWSRPYRTK